MIKAQQLNSIYAQLHIYSSVHQVIHCISFSNYMPPSAIWLQTLKMSI